ncbi:MAG: hypothetical protein ACK5MD_02875 [Flavobacteriales bacterium]
MKKFLKRLRNYILLLGVIFIISVLVYIYNDPFKVVWNYDPIVEENGYPNLIMPVNRDYVSTITLENNLKKGIHYNSFIFGNSRSGYYRIKEWKKYLDKEAVPYHFDASAEILYGIYKKIEYLDKKEMDIKNVLIAFDHTIMPIEQNYSHIFIKSPQIVDELFYPVKFHFSFYKAFYSGPVLKRYVPIILFGHKKNPSSIGDEYEILTNEERHPQMEKKITEGKFYDEKRMEAFFERPDTIEYSQESLTKIHKYYFTEIKYIFDKHNTNYKIIINPLYDQIKLKPEVKKFIDSLFGRRNVYDFSGKNKYTEDYHNYYEDSHFRSHVGAEILKEIYK